MKIKKVFVAGGGPAGMEAARIAAVRGHKVTLYEKERLGGQINMALLPPGKDEFQLLLDYQEGQLGKLHVSLETMELTPEIVTREKPDAVIVATGSMPSRPQIPGIDGNNVLTAWQVLKGDIPKNERVVVIGGGATGVETAEILSLNGNKVTIVEQLEAIAGDVLPLPFYYLALLKTVKLLGINVMTGIVVREIAGNAVIGESGSERIAIDADKVVLAVGIKSNNSLATQLENLGVELYTAGDCRGTGKLADAIREGFNAGLEV